MRKVIYSMYYVVATRTCMVYEIWRFHGDENSVVVLWVANLKMGEARSFETLPSSNIPARRHNPEDHDLNASFHA